jgi:uncharacterized DUF497 family protein
MPIEETAPMFEWDDNKNNGNIAKHGIDFNAAMEIWSGHVIEVADVRQKYGEDRFVAFGELNGRVLAVVFTWRGLTRRIISARSADRGERAEYHKAITDRSKT